MPRQLSNAAKLAIYANETGEAFIILCTITHPNFEEDIRISSDPYELLPDAGLRGVISGGLEYIFAPFTINLPSQDDTGVSRAAISIDNIDRRIVKAARQANSALSFSVEVVLSSNVNLPQISIQDYRLERVVYDAFTVSGEISVEYYDLEPFPQGTFNPSNFPGIF